MPQTLGIQTWITAIATALYTVLVAVTLIYVIIQVKQIKNQVKENRLLREAGVLKEISEYIDKSHDARKVIYKHKNAILAITNTKQLISLEKRNKEVYASIYSVAHCYHHVGFIIKYHAITNLEAIVEEAGDTFLQIYPIIKKVIELERIRIKKPTYKQYFEYFYDIISNITQKRGLKMKKEPNRKK